MRKTISLLFCDFCGKDQHKVKKLIAGPKEVMICNDCIDFCYDIVHGISGDRETEAWMKTFTIGEPR